MPLDNVQQRYEEPLGFLMGQFDGRWNDHMIPLLGAKLGGVQDPSLTKFRDDGAGSTGVFAYAFSKSAVNSVFVSGQIPHDWEEGSTVRPHVHWLPNGTANTGAVVWGLEFVRFGGQGGAVPAVTSLLSATHTFSEDQTGEQVITPFGSVDMSGLPISSVFVARLFRAGNDAADTFDDVVFGLSFDIHYQVDGTGSNAEFVK